MSLNFDNDAAIIAATTQEKAPNGRTRLNLSGSHLPDGQALSVLAEKLDASTATMWCAEVRREYERQVEQRTKKSREAYAHKGDSDGTDSVSEQSRGGSGSAAEAVQATEEPIHVVIERRYANLIVQQDRLQWEVDSATADLAKVEDEISKIENVMEVLNVGPFSESQDDRYVGQPSVGDTEEARDACGDSVAQDVPESGGQASCDEEN